MNNKMLKLALFVLITPILLILLCRLMIETVHFLSTTFFLPPLKDTWKEQTSPLSDEQIQILCQNFLIKKDVLCSGVDNVYGPEFYPAIIEALHPEEEFSPYRIGPTPANYDIVEEKLGLFKLGCGEVESAPGYLDQYFICDYDLRGDGQFIMGIFFRYPEMTVFRITTPMEDD